MSRTITGNNGHIALGGGDNPVSVVATAVVGGIDGYAGVQWNITNAGLIQGYGNGIALRTGGLIFNQAGGSIVGSTGVYIYHSYSFVRATVINAGGITGTGVWGVQFHAEGGIVSNLSTGTISNGVYISGGGAVTNAASGTITGSGNLEAIDLRSGAASVTNAGAILGPGAAFDGVKFENGGGVINQVTGTIAGGKRGIVSYGAMTVTNAGTISGTVSYGAELESSGGLLNLGVSNLSTGSIGGAKRGVFVSGFSSGTVVNQGAISGTSQYGVDFAFGGFVSNLSSGVIIGGQLGVFVTNQRGTVINAGTITGSGTAGVMFVYGGNVTNQASGTIAGGIEGVIFTTVSGAVINAGTITGTSKYGVYLPSGGSVTNQASGVIQGGTIGVFAKSFIDVSNAGAIQGTAKYGVKLAGAGNVYNLGGGAIGGGIDGVLITGSSYGTVVNAGSISGGGTAGVYLASGGAVTNQSSGTITGYRNGIRIHGTVQSVWNAGVVTGGGGANTQAGIALTGTGSVTNQLSGTIGGYYGILLAAGGTVRNAGVVSGSGIYGIRSNAGGSVSNAASGTISGSIAGVFITGASAGTVTNAGMVTATNKYAVYLPSGGVVTNQADGTISGNFNGVQFHSQTGTVVNAGAIVGVYFPAIRFIATTNGVVTNQIGGTIAGKTDGIDVFSGTATVTNAGIISGAIDAVSFAGSATVINQATGTLSGGSMAIDIAGASGSVSNAGLILGEVALHGAETVSNLAGGTIRSTAGNGMYLLGNNPSVTNAGLIAASGGNGVRLLNGGAVTNQASGTINGSGGGVVATGSATLTNLGTVVGVSQYGAFFLNGGTISNQFNVASISGGIDGVRIRGGLGSVTNSGVISGTTKYGVNLLTGGGVANQSGGTISGATEGIYATGATAGTVSNAGTVSGTSKYGVYFKSGGLITNQSGGTIAGGQDGILVKGAAATVTNAGRVSGATAAIVMAAGFSNRLIDDPGAAFYGLVNGGNTIGATAVSTLELASTSTAGVLSGLGSQFINFAQMTIDAGAQWTMTGANTLATGATITNSGELTFFQGNLSGAGTLVNNGLLQIEAESSPTLAALSGTGQVLIGAGGTLTVTGAVSATETIDLAGGAIYLNQTLTNSGVISAEVFSGSLFGLRNLPGATISTSSGNGIYILNFITVTNAGAILASNGNGVRLADGADVINLAGATIQGSGGGDVVTGGNGTLTNAGTVIGVNQYGVAFLSGGTVTNQSAGAISGGVTGVYVNGGTGTVINTGSISGATKRGVQMVNGGTVTNLIGGTIGGATDGVYLSGASAGVISNAGSISGAQHGILVGGDGATVSNSGWIGGASGAVVLASGFTNRLIVDPGAMFSGTVNGGNTINGAFASTLELAAGAAFGQLSGLGSQFINFAQTTIDAGASWTLTGANTLAAGTTLTNSGVLTVFDGSLNDAGSVINNGLIQDDPSTMTVGTLTGTGQVLIGGDSTLTVSGAVAAGETIEFAGTGLLALVPAQFSGRIAGLGGGGRIELTGITDATSASIINGNTLAIPRSGGPTIDLILDPTQSYAGVVFPVTTLGGAQFVGASEQVGPTVISQGQTMSVTGAAGSALAAVAGGLGGITVTGANSLFRTTSGTFAVGDSGFGQLSINADGTAAIGTGAVIANTSGASGSGIAVSGAGSQLTVAGSLIVGQAGFGQLSVSQGASVTAGSLDIAAVSGGGGVVTVVGAGTSLTTTGSLSVGDAGAGELSILNGANVTIGGDLDVASGPGGSGNVDIENTTGLTIINGNLNVGLGGGSATMTIGLNTQVQFDNGGISEGKFAKIIQHTAFDPAFLATGGGGFALPTGTSTFKAYVNNPAGQITQDAAGDLTVLQTPTIYGAGGTFQIATGGAALTLEADGVTGQTFQFTDNTGTLVIGIDQLTTIDTPASGTGPFTLVANPNFGKDLIGGFAGTISGFVAGDVIKVNTTASAGFTLNGSVISVVDNVGGATEGTIAFANASMASLAAGTSSALVDQVACFAEGTLIETANGLMAVEDLAVGDDVRTLSGTAPIVWLGQRAVDCARHPKPETVWPVRVCTGAFGMNVPERDLYLSPDHAVFVNDVLVPVKLLINGTTIAQVKRNRARYFHVELPEHSVILAEGLAVESYLDTGDRANFADNGAIRLFPDFAARLAPDAARLWESKGAAPLVQAGPRLNLAKRQIVRHSHEPGPSTRSSKGQSEFRMGRNNSRHSPA